MLKQHRQIATADDNADERSTSLALTFPVFAELVAKDAFEMRR